MVFQHDWGIFFLIKELTVVHKAILQAIGFAVLNSTLYPHHLFNRIYATARRSEANQNVSIKNGERQDSFCLVRLASKLWVGKQISADGHAEYLIISSSHHQLFFDVEPGKIYLSRFCDAPFERDRNELKEVLQFFLKS